jgi:hypothetical protein
MSFRFRKANYRSSKQMKTTRSQRKGKQSNLIYKCKVARYSLMRLGKQKKNLSSKEKETTGLGVYCQIQQDNLKAIVLL